MQYRGKLTGFVIGMILGRGFYGALLGLAIGHFIDQLSSKNKKGLFTNQRTRSELFFRTTFQVMGHLTKSKGCVTQVDIQTASFFMDKMRLGHDARTIAQQAFKEGKDPNYPLKIKLKEFRQVCFGRADLLHMFLEFQLQAAFADGRLHPNERQILYVIAEELGVSQTQFEQFLSMMEGERSFNDYSQQKNHYQQHSAPTIKDAYKVLGVHANDDPTTIKRAYRKLMSEHHPDKLIAKGLPAEMLEIAKQKTQDIQFAYDIIKKNKKFK